MATGFIRCVSICLALLGGCGDGRATDPDADGSAGTRQARHPAPWFGRLHAGPGEPEDPRPLDFYAVSQPISEGLANGSRRSGRTGTALFTSERTTGPDEQPRQRTLLYRDGAPPPDTAAPVPADAARLWDWMDDLRDRGIDTLAIPHGPGPGMASAAAAERRLRNEPLVATAGLDGEANGVVDALLHGIALEARRGFNPFQFGIVGGAAGTALTGVWAPDSSATAIYDALRRRESFVTSGPRIALRLVAGFGLAADAHQREPAAGGGAVPMGGDLLPAAGPLRFAARAGQDPQAAPLARLQIVKGWVAEGRVHRRSYDIACAGRAPDPATGRCPDEGDPAGPCGADPAVGAGVLAVTWEDPDFHASQEAFYYLRALTTAACDGAAAAEPERAWSSPIWYHGSLTR